MKVEPFKYVRENYKNPLNFNGFLLKDIMLFIYLPIFVA